MIPKPKRSKKWIKNQIENLNYAGIHLIAEFYNGKIIDSPKEIEKILVEAAKKANNTPLQASVHKFSPRGITGVVLLAESHLAIHTWPEINYMAVDIFTCGQKTFPERALNYLKKKFQPRKVKIIKIERGNLK